MNTTPLNTCSFLVNIYFQTITRVTVLYSGVKETGAIPAHLLLAAVAAAVTAGVVVTGAYLCLLKFNFCTEIVLIHV